MLGLSVAYQVKQQMIALCNKVLESVKFTEPNIVAHHAHYGITSFMIWSKSYHENFSSHFDF